MSPRDAVTFYGDSESPQTLRTWRLLRTNNRSQANNLTCGFTTDHHGKFEPHLNLRFCRQRAGRPKKHPRLADIDRRSLKPCGTLQHAKSDGEVHREPFCPDRNFDWPARWRRRHLLGRTAIHLFAGVRGDLQRLTVARPNAIEKKCKAPLCDLQAPFPVSPEFNLSAENPHDGLPQ